MSEITKLYENAGIEKSFFYSLYANKCEYPPFTAEKQIELIKWLCKRCFYIEISEMGNKSYGIAFKYQPADEYKSEQSECCTNKNFAEALAESINYLWQDLTTEEKQQVKGILE